MLVSKSMTSKVNKPFQSIYLLLDWIWVFHKFYGFFSPLNKHRTFKISKHLQQNFFLNQRENNCEEHVTQRKA